MIHFNYKGNSYTIITWIIDLRVNPSGMVKIKKAGGKFVKLIIYPDNWTVKDFLHKLEKINFM